MGSKRADDIKRDDNHWEIAGDGDKVAPFRLVTDVNIQDQTTPVLIVPFKKDYLVTTLTADSGVGVKVISLASVAGAVVGDHIRLFNETNNTFYQGKITAINTLDVTLDSPLDRAYASGDTVGLGKTNMAVNGAVTPQVFNIRAPDPGISVVGDITRINIIMETTVTPEWGLFGDRAVLANGLLLRRTDGTTTNIFNAKSNAELANIMYDLDFLDFTKFATYGVKGRLTFGGQNKIGVVIRLDVGEDLEFVVQDDLSSLVALHVIAEGHVVE